MALTQDQIDAFWQDGFVSYGPILDEAEVQLLRREYDAEFEKAWAANSLQNLSVEYNLKVEEKQQAPQHMLQIMQMCERNIHFRRLVHNERILDLVQDLIGPNLMLFHDQALFKPAHNGGAVFWHQDNAYWKCLPATLVSCWLTLDDVNVDNGAMQLIPGSHLKPMRHDKGEKTGALFDVQNEVDAGKAVVVDLPAGGCMLHHCQTLHYTQPNTTDRQRRAFAIHFMQPGTRSGHVADKATIHTDFAHPILRMGF